MDVLVLIGRILFVVLFLGASVNHLGKTAAMAGYAKSRGVPFATPATLVTGTMLLFGGLSVLLGIWADLGALVLFLFLVPTAVLMHAFWRETEAGARQNEMLHFMKDLALGGASLMLFALIAHAGDELGLMITAPLFTID
ncbi:DoxX family protein [Streptomyces alkaliterrae]|uniref:DoxX family membrane protein n=1 Tax=Streptomyces alkaliterrae TaxID=2213162 RepID=A0A5P0YQK1_9ACTN|nr:DoxX family protein [Streptomyces alkaliterrae]MBB1261280.1 DoxX family protein [Streptomyces alkaliterrae]MQS02545.1 DoxX family membrane protein [Streptomyces alkaliterrae]